MAYPTVSVIVDYHYSPRKWLDTLIATKGGSDLFKQELTFDAAGRITRQMSSHGGGSAYRQDYGYDAIGQLTSWLKKPPGQQQITESYTYDAVGNREEVAQGGPGAGSPAPHFEYDLGRGSGPGVGPNQLLKVQEWLDTTAGDYTEYTYDPDGSMNSRKRYTSTNVLTMEERFGYSSWRGLSWKYEREDPNITVGPNIWEYRYRYNAMGEREQKREWLNPDGDGTVPGYKWIYYLVGGEKEQLSVWQGMQTSESGFCEDTGTGSEVYLYPVEYSSYAVEYNAEIEDILRLTTKSDGSIEYYITDHLASLRVKLDDNGQVLLSNDYTPFGGLLVGQYDRRLFNSREKDNEHGLYNNGVRKLNNNEGRFTSVDPLWENFRNWSPYAYGYNNPLKVTDPDGNQGRPAGRRSQRSQRTLWERTVERLRRALVDPAPPPVPRQPTQAEQQRQSQRREGQVRENMERNSANQPSQPLENTRPSGQTGPVRLQGTSTSSSSSSQASLPQPTTIPVEALTVARQVVNNNGSAPTGYKGGRTFRNDGRGGGQVLPQNTSSGAAVTYREYDIHPYQKGANRGQERIVVGSDGRVWYTNNHYQTFVQILGW